MRGLYLPVAVMPVVLSGCSRDTSPADTAAGGAPVTSAAPPAAGRVFVTDEGGGDLGVVDVATAKVVATVPVGKRPRGIRASPDGRLLYVALSGSPRAPPVAIVDVASRAVKAKVPVGDRPWGVVFLP